MNALRISLLTLVATFALTACGPADAYVAADGEETTLDAESELAATIGKFETFEGKDGRTYFHLLAGTGQKILASQGYSSLAASCVALGDRDQSAKHNSTDTLTFTINIELCESTQKKETENATQLTLKKLS